MKRDQAVKKLKALKELAERGVGGEKEGAQRLYNKLKSKYGISEEELQERQQEPQEKPLDGGEMFQAATAAMLLKEEQQECDGCPARYGQKECEECGTYAEGGALSTPRRPPRNRAPLPAPFLPPLRWSRRRMRSPSPGPPGPQEPSRAQARPR